MADELAGTLRGAGRGSITPAGSLRRGRETVGDLDLLVTGPGANPRARPLRRHPRVEEVLGRGENKASAKVGREGLQVDVRALPPAASAPRCNISPAARITTSPCARAP
jgi:DNA polymerase (family X)